MRITCCFWLVMVASLVAVSVLPSAAQETNSNATPVPIILRWKFKVGDELQYRVVDDMTLRASGPPLGETSAPMRQEMNIQWTVRRVDRNGTAVMAQKISDVRMSIVGPKGERVEYNSAAEDPSASLAAMVAPIYDALVAGEIEFTMSSRGEISAVRVPEKVMEALKNTAGLPPASNLTSPDGLQQMIAKWAPVLPSAAVKPGDQWRSTTHAQDANADAGIETAYQFEGTKEVDGQTLAVFRPEVQDARSEGTNSRADVGKQTVSGEVLFDVAAGRLQSATWNLKLTTKLTTGGHTVDQHIEQKLEANLVRP